MNSYKVQGSQGVLIQLIPFLSSTTKTQAGLIIPKYKDHETDGGRFVAAMEDPKWTTVGRVLQISAKAQQILDDEKMDIVVGDIISVKPSAKQVYNWFIDDKFSTVAPWEGKLLVNPNVIEAKIIDDTLLVNEQELKNE